MGILDSNKKYAFIFLLSLMAFALHGQRKKDLQEGIDTLMAKGSYEKAMPVLRKYIEQQPEDAYAYYRLATAHKELLEDLYLHQEQMLKLEYDSATSIFERAIQLVDKKELRRNKDHYQRVFFGKDFTESDVQDFFRQSMEEVEGYYGKLAFLRVRLQPIQQSYIQAERSFRSIIAPYKKLPSLHRDATEEEIERVRNLQLLISDVEGHIDTYNRIFVDSPALREKQKQQFSWQEINGLNLYSIEGDDFKRKSVKLFDFGSWSRDQLDHIYKFRKLKQELEQFQENITAASIATPVDTQVDTARMLRDILQWRESLLQYEAGAVVPKLLLYNYEKLRFLMDEESTRQVFARVYPDKATRNQLINGLAKQIIDLQLKLRELPTDTASYKGYEAFAQLCCNGIGGIQRWKVLEDNQLTQHLGHWNNVRARTAMLKASLPDSIVFKNTPLLLRPAKFDLREASAQGWYVNELIAYLPDSTFISQGRYTTNGKVRPYMALLDTSAKVKWMYSFPDQGEWCNKISNLKVFSDGSSCYFAYRDKDGAERITLEYLDANGKLEYSRIIASIPKKIFHTQKPKGIVLVREVKEGEGDKSFSRFELEGYSFEGKNKGKPVLTRFLIRGHIAGIVAHESGVYLVANFLEYQDMNGNFSDSRAYRKGGFNVLGLNLSLKRGQTVFDPVFSMQPIVVTAVNLEADGKLRLTGLQGDYEYYSPTNITGGQPWLRYLNP